MSGYIFPKVRTILGARFWCGRFGRVFFWVCGGRIFAGAVMDPLRVILPENRLIECGAEWARVRSGVRVSARLVDGWMVVHVDVEGRGVVQVARFERSRTAAFFAQHVLMTADQGEYGKGTPLCSRARYGGAVSWVGLRRGVVPPKMGVQARIQALDNVHDF